MLHGKWHGRRRFALMLAAMLTLAGPLGAVAATNIGSYAELAAFAAAGPTLPGRYYDGIILTGDIIFEETGMGVYADTIVFDGHVSIASEEGAQYTIGYEKDSNGNYLVAEANRVQLIAVGTRDDEYSLTMRNVTVTGGRAAGQVQDDDGRSGCGAVYASASAEIINCVFEGNYGLYGGGLYSDIGVTATDSVFTGNKAAVMGGGLYGFTVTVSGSTFEGNEAGNGQDAGWGGGLYANLDARISGSKFIGNSAYVDGGGAYVTRTAHVAGGEFSGNVAGQNGGGLYIRDDAGSDLSTITDVVFHNNRANGNGAGGEGGAIYSEGKLTAHGRDYFEGNTPSGNSPADDPGYGIYVKDGKVLEVIGELIKGLPPEPEPEPEPDPDPDPKPDPKPVVGYMDPVGGEPPSHERAAEIVNCSEWVYLRGDASTDNPPEGKIPLGARVTVYGYVAGFAQIIYGNTTYYVHGDFVALR